MKKPYICFLLVAYSFTACKKDKTTAAPAPVADFSLANNKSANIVVDEANSGTLDNTSRNATVYFWDFGNGTTSTETKPAQIFQQGNYTISLTAKNSDGQSSTVKKQVKIVAQVLKDITIQELDWTQKIKNVPDFKTADVWVEILKREADKNYTMLPNGVYDAPLLYKSKVYKNATIYSAPVNLSVDEKVILNKYTAKGARINYAVNLYAKDTGGTTYLLHSTDIGVGTGLFLEDLKNNYFKWNTGRFDGCLIYLNGSYE